jgi:dTDP-4-dehydrorhamnose reductase
MSNICILGDGLLASELEKQTNWDVISRKRNQFDITQPNDWYKHLLQIEHGVVIYPKYKTLINCIAYTKTYSEDKQTNWDVNLLGTKNLIDFCNLWKIKLVHISTDYIYSHSKSNASELDPPSHCATWYGYTKLVSDALVQLECQNYLVIRTTHKPKPFPYEKAWTSQVGNFDYIDVIASQIVKLIEKEANGVFNIGTELKSMFELAKKTNLEVLPEKTLPLLTPNDISMNISKFINFINK